jgi:hypothetical protein
MEYIPILLPLALADDGVRERSDGELNCRISHGRVSATDGLRELDRRRDGRETSA